MMSFDGDYWYCVPLGSHKRHIFDCYTHMIEIYGKNMGNDKFNEIVGISITLTKLAAHQSVLIYLAISVEFAINDGDYLKTREEFLILKTFSSHLKIMVDKNGLTHVIERLVKLLKTEWSRIKNLKIKLLEPDLSRA